MNASLVRPVVVLKTWSPLLCPCSLASQVGLAVQGASLAGMFMVNAVMLSIYLKALQMSGSTVATVTNFATNFLLSVRKNKTMFGSLYLVRGCRKTRLHAGVPASFLETPACSLRLLTPWSLRCLLPACWRYTCSPNTGSPRRRAATLCVDSGVSLACGTCRTPVAEVEVSSP